MEYEPALYYLFDTETNHSIVIFKETDMYCVGHNLSINKLFKIKKRQLTEFIKKGTYDISKSEFRNI